MKASQKTLAFWFLAVVVSIFVMQSLQNRSEKFVKDFDFRKFKTAVEKGEVADVTLLPDAGRIRGNVKPEFETQYKGKTFDFEGETGDKIYELLEKNNITPNYERGDSASFFQNLAANYLPVLLIVGLFIFLMRQLQVGGGKAMSFGKSRAKLLTESKLKVLFKDVAGVDEAKDDLVEIVNFLKDPKKFTRLGGRIPKGVLLVGSPGTGKTLLARAVAGEAGVPFFSISGSDFVEMFVGVGASRVRDLFEQGKKHAPCLIFIDEIDAVGRHRGAGMGGGHDEREQTLNQLLVEMDGFESNEGVIMIAATNRPDVLDPALLRPGRFDRRVVVNRPDVKGREQILNVHTRKTPLAPGIDVLAIARGTPGFSGADLENLVNEAALGAARADKKFLENEDFEKAKDKVIMGSERRSMVISEEDKKATACHEAGHTLVGKILKGLDPIHKVTIIPRGMALGLTQTLPEKDALNISKTRAQNMIAFMYGGRAAEEIVYGDFNTGAGNDIERATDIARRMVCEWGMSAKLGHQSYEKSESPVFLGMQYGQKTREYSDARAEQIDAEVALIIDTGYKTAMKILTENRKTLDQLTEALLELESLDGPEIDMIINGAEISELVKVRANKERGSGLSNRLASAASSTAGSASGSGGSDPVGEPGPATT